MDAAEKVKVGGILVGLEVVRAGGVRGARLRLHRELQRRGAGGATQREPGVGDERLHVHVVGARIGRGLRAPRRRRVQEVRRE